MNIHEIYNLLMAGKTLSLEFDGRREAEEFRIKVAKYKRAQDTQIIKLGMIEPHEKQVFSFTLQDQMPPLAPALATLVFKDKSITRQYTVKIIDEDENDEEKA